MFKNLTYKKKIRWLLIGVVLFFFISYSLSIKKTVRAWTEYSDLTDSLSSVEDAPVKISQIEKKLREIETHIGTSLSDSVSFQEMLYEKVSNYCQENGLVLSEFPQIHTYTEQDFEVETNFVVVQGAYLGLLKLLYSLEQKEKLGKVVSVKFATEKDFKTKRIILTASIYFQNIKKLKHESS